MGRNTAPTIALAPLHATAGGQDGMLLILAAYHLITDRAAFHESVNNALPLAEYWKLLTFGIAPASAEAGYRHIQKWLALNNEGFAVEGFVDKAGLRHGSQLPGIW